MLCRFLLFKLRHVSFIHDLAVSNECPNYPPIIDMSNEGQRRHRRQLWYDSIKRLPTAEQKLYELGLQQRADLRLYFVSACAPTYEGTSFYHYITRTHFIDGLPEKLTFDVENQFNDVKDSLCDVLLKYYYNAWQKDQRTLADHLAENYSGTKLLNSLLSQCYKKFSLTHEHLLESTIHNKPRLRSFWWHGDFKSPPKCNNLCFQFTEQPALILRMKTPLSPIIDMDDPFCSTHEVQNFNYHPRVLGIPFKAKSFLTSVPGFWPSDPFEYPLLLVYTRDKLLKLESKIEKYDLKKIEDSVSVMASFGWLNAIAQYQGFTPFHDLTYPITAQTILTNGQDWNFIVYQLNTISFHSDVDMKDRQNICWSSGKLRLFDTVEDGQVKGINDEVLKMLLRFLLHVPKFPEYELKPYLGEDTRSEEDILILRTFLRNRYSNRPHCNAYRDEIPMWQRIYKFHKEAPPCPYIKLE